MPLVQWVPPALGQGMVVETPNAWVRSANNPILSPTESWETTAVQEPNVFYENGTWKMWYTGAFMANAMGYATCSGDPLLPGNWTKHPSNPVLGQGTVVAGWVAGPNVCKVASTYYAFYYDALGGGNLKVSTSTDGISWGTPATAISKSAVPWTSGWTNSFVWNEGGSNWKMLVEGRSTAAGTPWRTAYATSPDGLAWTIRGSEALSSLIVSNGDQSGGPWLANGGNLLNGYYQLWLHVGVTPRSNIRRAISRDAQNWTFVSQELNANLGTYEAEQVADPSVLEVNGASYIFYSGVNNATSTSYISAASSPLPLATRTS